jgi:serine protease AprX
MTFKVWLPRLLGALVLPVLVASPATAQGRVRLDAAVEDALRNNSELPVIVSFTDSTTRDRAFAKLRGRERFKAVPAFSTKADKQALLDLLNTPGVDGISYDAPVAGHQLEDLSTGGSAVESVGGKLAAARYGVAGAGVNVAVIDSGVQPHADLPATRIRAFVDFVNRRPFPYDDYGHGTHVAGIIAGSGASSGGTYAGVAPQAGIVALKVLDSRGIGRTSHVLAAIDWVLNYGKSYNVRVVNISLGHPIYESAKSDPLAIAVDKLMHDGFVVVVSAGNLGATSTYGSLYGGITSPANAQGAIAVGAVNTQGTIARSDDTVTSFSSRGPTRFDRFSKPDLVAPGHGITSLDSYGFLSTTYPWLRLLSGYIRLSGTSMAAPTVSGTAALVLSANPQLSAHAVKAVLQFTAQRLPASDVLTQGAGLVNAPAAVRLATLIRPEARSGSVWLLGNRAPITADLLFGEVAHWGRAFIWANKLIPTNSIYVKLKQWRDDDAWGFKPEEVVRGYENLQFSGTSDYDEAVWGLNDDNVIWGYLDDNIVWSMNDNIVWGMDDNIVWGMDDNIVWGYLDDNIVWGMLGEYLVWRSSDDNIVWGMEDDNILWSMAVLTGEVR